MLDTKILINSNIYDAQQGSRFMSCDLKYLFLATPMLQPEYKKIRIRFFPQDIIEKYNFMNKVSYGYVYMNHKINVWTK